ncbi:MAG: pyrroline-5-carboxylate reductase [Vampirovibrio sp.]|nr:pyrroline-5-carboxylate reductase [Vampirovibrio sp.]
MSELVIAGKLGVVGAGVMGRTIIQGAIKSCLLPPQKIWAAARTQRTCDQVRQELGIDTFTDYTVQLAETSIIILCVKPYKVEGVLEHLKDNGLSPDTLIISIAAGVSLATLESLTGGQNPVIRAMPNTPCVVGRGMTVVCGSAQTKPQHLELTKNLFSAVGTCLELEETHFDAVTGLSGSGPAYFYLMMESLADGGVRVGLPRDVAVKLVTQTALGAAAMVQQSGRHPASLRDDVTTPAGCTIAALLTMEDGKIRSVLARAVEEATRTASHLGGSASSEKTLATAAHPD